MVKRRSLPSSATYPNAYQARPYRDPPQRKQTFPLGPHWTCSLARPADARSMVVRGDTSRYGKYICSGEGWGQMRKIRGQREFDPAKASAKRWFALGFVCGFLIALAAGVPPKEATFWGIGLGSIFCVAILFAPETTYRVVFDLIVQPAFGVLCAVLWASACLSIARIVTMLGCLISRASAAASRMIRASFASVFMITLPNGKRNKAVAVPSK